MDDVETWHPRLATGHWYSHLPADLQNSLLASARLRQLTAGQYLFKRGDAPCGLYAVLEGSLEVGHTAEELNLVGGDFAIPVGAEFQIQKPISQWVWLRTIIPYF